MRQIGHMILACTGLIVFTLAGCVAGPSRLELDYGTSYGSAKSSQIVNPEAKKNRQPVEGFDGIAAEKSLARYRKTFETPPESPAFAISVGKIK